ncbi:hypothetical protein [Parafrankia discariae]|uniref:hypothetical protein n=1 Tax=Parafrankia discariae TaxID=365528 RepID=UPI00039EE717|nr:hypothetical protein [Parafrankia discariae]
MGTPTPMDHEAAARITRAAWERPDSDTAHSGFDARAREAADLNEGDDWPGWDEEEDPAWPQGVFNPATARLIRARKVNAVASPPDLS